MTPRLAGIWACALAALLPGVATAAQLEFPVVVAGAPLPADGPAASLLHPSALHATFRVARTEDALYIATPWFVRDLTVTIDGPGTAHRTLVASASLPGAMLGVRLPDDAWRAGRIDLDATAVSTVAPPYLLSGEQLARVSSSTWTYAALFGAFGALALLAAAAALALRSRLAAWFAAAAAANAALEIPWLGLVRPSPEISQPVHALVSTCTSVALVQLALTYLGACAPRTLRAALWSTAGVAIAFAWGGDVLQDAWPVPEAAVQAAALAFDAALVAAALLALRERIAGAPWYLAATSLAALPALAAALPLVTAAGERALSTAAAASAPLLLALAVAAALREREIARRTAALGARADGLTGLPNRDAFDAALRAACTRARARREPLAVVLLDVDHLRAYNECYGHLAGDDVLRRIASVVRADAQCRAGACAARYGGEEFALLLPRATHADARAAAESLRAAVMALDVAHGGVPSRRLTASAGAALLAPDAAGDVAAGVLRRASDALYVAKTLGRNRVVADEPAAAYEAKTESATASFTT